MAIFYLVLRDVACIRTTVNIVIRIKKDTVCFMTSYDNLIWSQGIVA